MSHLEIPASLLAKTKTKSFEYLRTEMKGSKNAHASYCLYDLDSYDDESLREFAQLSKGASENKTARVLESILRSREGKFDKPVPSFKAFHPSLGLYLRAGLIDGWVYATGEDGKLYPHLVTQIEFSAGSGRSKYDVDTVTIHMMGYGQCNLSERFQSHLVGLHSAHFTFRADEVANRRIATILADKGLYKETPEFKAEHEESLKRYRQGTQKGFAKQFRATGLTYCFEKDRNRKDHTLKEVRAIHDLSTADFAPVVTEMESCLIDRRGDKAGIGSLPEHPVVRLFDLKTHEYIWCHTDNLKPHRYDKSLREKIVLPKTHHDLLDILTSNLDDFTADIVEGKSAGNIILCKGIPGVGKTLAAEIYAELIERPLYKVHSGLLGTDAENVEKGLQKLFHRAKRWDCVLLLDEADVFIKRRGDNIEQNAIVAEFLKTLEYFDGLFFMTTNRPHDIDEAIVSRCMAVINMKPPATREDAAAVWHVHAENNGIKLPSELIEQLYRTFPKLAPRDVKNLLRLVLRSNAKTKEPLSIDVFRRYAMFRDIEMLPLDAKSSTPVEAARTGLKNALSTYRDSMPAGLKEMLSEAHELLQTEDLQVA